MLRIRTDDFCLHGSDLQDGPHVRLVARDDEKDVEGRGKLGQSILAARIAVEAIQTIERLLKEGLPREMLEPLMPYQKLPPQTPPESLRLTRPRMPEPFMLQKEMGLVLSLAMHCSICGVIMLIVSRIDLN